MKNKSILNSCMLLVFTFVLSMSHMLGQSSVEQIDNLLSKYHEYGKFNGSVLVATNGKIIYKKGFGMANMEWDIPNASNTKHRLGSITKQFTAMLILQEVAAGKIDLQAPITDYLPDYNKENGDRISCHQLLIHASGIPNYTSFAGFFQNESRNPYTPEEFVENFEDLELEFEPGAEFNYSNSGYFLLGVILEEITGKTYETLLHEKIFSPLAMDDSGYDNFGDILKNRATGYEKSGVGFENSRYLDMSIPYAAGSVYSTVEDLFKWDQALYTEKLLSKEHMDLYFKPAIPAFGNSYAYGWIVGYETIGNTKDSIYAISHGGGINGFNTNISRTTEDESLIVLLNNTGGAPLNNITEAIRGIIYEKTYDLPKKSLANDVLNIINENGISAGVAHFYENKESEKYDLSEREMNQIGYQLMGEKKAKEAVQIFKLNVDAFPASSNVYDSYAEALMELGKNKLAIVNFKKSIELNPANQNGIDMLEKLGEDVSVYTKEVVVPTAILDSYVGNYELMPGFVLTVMREGNQMKAKATGQPTLDIFPKSNHVFYLKAITAQLTFNKNDAGEIESVTLLQGGNEMVGKRLAE